MSKPEWEGYRDRKEWQRDKTKEVMRPILGFGIAMLITGAAAGFIIASVWFYYHPW